MQFTADEVTTGTANLSVAAQAADDAGAFTEERLLAPTDGRHGGLAAGLVAEGRCPDGRAPDLAAVVQEVVSRTDWVMGNDRALVVTGAGTRTAEAYEGGAAEAAVLYIEYIQ